MKKKILAIIAAVLCIGTLLSGCGSKMTPEDAQAYVASALDAAFKGELDEYMKQTDSTREEAQAMYDLGIETNMQNSGFEDAGISEELQEKYRQLYMDLYKQVDYTLGNAQETEDGFTVDVTVKPFTIFDTLNEDLLHIVETDPTAAALTTEAEMNEFVYQKMYELMSASAEEPTYGEPVTITVHVTKNSDGIYTINEDDLSQVDLAAFPS